MAKTESTAVNELVDLVRARKRRAASEPARDLFTLPTSAPRHPPRMTSTIPPMRGAGEVAPLPRSRAPLATAQHQQLPTSDVPNVRIRPVTPSRGTTIPPLVRGRVVAQGTLAPPIPTSRPQPLFPVIQPPDAPTDHWYEAPRASLGSRRDTSRLKKLIVPTIALSVVGAVACYLAFDNAPRPSTTTTVAASGTVAGTPATQAAPTPGVVAARPAPQDLAERRAAPRAESDNAATASAGGGDAEPPTKAEQADEIARATAPQPSAAVATNETDTDAPPVTREAQTANGVINFVDVRIDSTPAGATVTLVDGGKQTFIGTTPISTFVDPARQYDLILELDGLPMRKRHIDPNKTSYIDVKLGAAKSVASAHAAETPSSAQRVRSRRAKRTTSAPSSQLAEPSFGLDETADGSDGDASMGILMVSTKPPCEILIDGKATGLVTPQRGIELPVGSHKVTFINEEMSIKKSFLVKVTAEKASKLIRDMMPK